MICSESYFLESILKKFMRSLILLDEIRFLGDVQRLTPCLVNFLNALIESAKKNDWGTLVVATIRQDISTTTGKSINYI